MIEARTISKFAARPIKPDLDAFLGLYFASGYERRVAKSLWLLLQGNYKLNLAGLHPDDDVFEIIELMIEEHQLDSLEKVETIMALEEDFIVQKGTRPTFKHIVTATVESNLKYG